MSNTSIIFYSLLYEGMTFNYRIKQLGFFENLKLILTMSGFWEFSKFPELWHSFKLYLGRETHKK